MSIKKVSIPIDKIKIPEELDLKLKLSPNYLNDLEKSIRDQGLILPLIIVPTDSEGNPIPYKEGCEFRVLFRRRVFFVISKILKWEHLTEGENCVIKEYPDRETMLIDSITQSTTRP